MLSSILSFYDGPTTLPPMSNTSSLQIPSESMTISLADPGMTVLLGQGLGTLFKTGAGPAVILLYGALGTGKTTLTRGLVEALPGGDQAEVSSPSFTLCNSYPTTPPVLHCDLYRTESGLPDEVDEALETNAGLVVIEWAQRIPASFLPPERLDILLQPCKSSRLAKLVPHGQAAGRILRELTRCTILFPLFEEEAPGHDEGL